MKKVYFKTFGCRTNKFDTQIMIDSLKSYQVTENLEEADAVVINSCTVTNGADSGVRNFISKVNREQPETKVYFTGCGVTTQGESLQKRDLITSAFSSSIKESINSLLNENKPFFKLAEQNHIDTTVVSDIVGNSRAFIKIQEGCDFDCSYCIIPTVRGVARSLKEETILKQVETLTKKGFSEFILTGTNVGSYGKDSGSSMAELILKISEIQGVVRIRIGSMEPIQITEELIDTLKVSKVDRYLHIALQHTNEKILKLMKRRNQYHVDKKLLERLTDLGFALGTDFIVGFPTESDEDWRDAIEKVKDLPLTHIHAFTYSKRDDTQAATMKPEVKGDIAKQRLKELTEVVDKKNFNFRISNSEPLKVLIEKSKEENGTFLNYGLDQFFNKVLVKSSRNLDGQWLEISEYQVENDKCVAQYDL